MTESTPTLAATPLHGLHVELGARMVPFAGYAMPLHYPAGIIKEHLHTRSHAGLFDVSHMGQVRLSGTAAAAAAALETLVPVDVVGLAAGRQRYALFTDEAGGILDDLMITNTGDGLLVVVNAACKSDDIAHLRRHLGEACQIEPLTGRALLALQGPHAAEALARLNPAVRELAFMNAATLTLDSVACFVARSGYTGEDGFEISVPAEHAEPLARRLLADPQVWPVGLGARDSLRLEAGLPLYGHDIDAATTPIEAALGWAISKSRRPDGERAGGFPGARIIFDQLAGGVARRRVGIRPNGRAPVREDTTLTDAGGTPIGRITSGGFGPSVGTPVAMGYVEARFATPATALVALVRGKPLPVEVAKLPFVPHSYHRR